FVSRSSGRTDPPAKSAGFLLLIFEARRRGITGGYRPTGLINGYERTHDPMRNRFYAYWYSYLPMLDADAGNGRSGGDAGQGDNPNSGDAGDGGNQGDDKGKQGQSQADIDKIVQQRLARAKKQWEADKQA